MANYLYSLLTSYEDAPKDMKVPDGMYYNASYPGNLIAMPQPLYGDDVDYADGADTSIEAISKDLVWESSRCNSRKCEPIADEIIEIIKKETEILNCNKFNLYI